MKYYLAYDGIDMTPGDFYNYCPNAVCIGHATLSGYQLVFRGSDETGTLLSLDKAKPHSTVPGLIYQMPDRDARSLDRFEGFPRFCSKVRQKVSVQDFLSGIVIGEVDAFTYILWDKAVFSKPDEEYYDLCLACYNRFGFDETLLEEAYERSCGCKR